MKMPWPFRTMSAVPAPGVEPEKIPPPRTGEIAWSESTLSLFSKGDFPKYNPDSLMTSKGAGIYLRMMLDDQIKAVVRFKQHAVVSRDFFFDIGVDEDGEPLPEHEEIAAFFEHVIKQMRGTFTDKLIEILSAIWAGFSITEKVYAPIEYQGRAWWGLKDLKTKPFDSFNGGIITDEFGEVLELKQVNGGKHIIIPYSKVIHFVYQADFDRHYGQSDLRACYRAWWSKDITIKFQNIFLERYASPFTWGTLPETGISTTDRTELQSLLNNLSAAAAAILPAGVDIKTSTAHSSNAYEQAISQHDKAIAKVHRRRAHLRKAEGKYTDKEWQELVAKYDGKCLCCGRGDLPMSVDHVIPLSRGGSNYIDNIQPLCRSCNTKKSTKTIDYRHTVMELRWQTTQEQPTI